MADTKDMSVLERLQRVEGKVDDLSARVVRLDQKIDGLAIDLRQADNRIENRIDALGAESRVSDASLETKLTKRIDVQGRRFDVQMEVLRDTITKFAEHLGGRLDDLSQQLSNNQRNLESTLATHELVLRNHGTRITALEHRRRK
jgi:hypothetical protein